jgi:signal transduction histidine kinase
MKLFVYDPTSDRFSVDFVPPTPETTLLDLHRSDNEVFGYFKVPTMDNYLMKAILPIKKYEERISSIHNDVIKGMILYLLLIAFVSLLLAFYSLQPIRRALRLNKEFMKDILHDVNTPIASIAINLKLLQKKFGEHIAIDRIDNNIETIGMMRENLHAYLGEKVEEESSFDLGGLIDERLDYFQTLYPHIVFENRIEQDSVAFKTRKRACIRILDNIIGNAAKYNKRDGSVTAYIEKDILVISDTGRGIQNVKKVFTRHYKEGERGMGLGLNIVWKLVVKLGISISIESEVDKGTKVKIDCSEVRVK